MNIVKHAETDEAFVSLSGNNGRILLDVSDNGKDSTRAFWMRPAPQLTPTDFSA